MAEALAGADRPAWWQSAVAATADLGIFLPIAVMLVVVNGLSATAVLVCAGLLYLLVAFVYRVPVPVQPMKAMTALAIASELPAPVIAAGALTIGALFVLLGLTGLLDRLAPLVPLAVVRGVQLAVGLALAKVAYGLVAHPAAAFTAPPSPLVTAVGAAVLVAVFVRWPRAGLALAMAAAVVVVAVSTPDGTTWGPAAVDLPELTLESFGLAAVLLVVPQAPLTVTSSCIATADAARHYFGPRAGRVRTGRLALTVGAGNLLSGLAAGMPMCHGSGGVSAHHRFGGRIGSTPAIAGAGLLVVGVVLGADFARRAGAFPIPVLVALLVTAALWHVRLLASLRRRRDWVIALAVGGGSLVVNLGVLVVLAMVTWWAVPALRRSPTMR
ncbi:molybdate transporter family protein [Jiangella asiatica]|uniref:Sulfate permease n=1 Tax=Jiangella asiatica TaxID=2530372 RepID=A0A4V2Z245_9ACTN|nr:molybdate transporter family protein [Jiangella asiatica]TDE07438.1 hypothetical protein E1269_19580 [Jiangella asiatica]